MKLIVWKCTIQLPDAAPIIKWATKTNQRRGSDRARTVAYRTQLLVSIKREIIDKTLIDPILLLKKPTKGLSNSWAMGMADEAAVMNGGLVCESSCDSKFQLN